MRSTRMPTLPRLVRRVGAGLFLLAALATAHGEVVLANFSATNLMKIMPVGDSITDDCVTNGAWRAPLQPILEANGLAFTNTGRITSPFVSPTFTKRRHEGYCGSVIGPPGYFAAHGYSAADAYLQRIVYDALTITNNRPDLMLILIGANDIGHGRSPVFVVNTMRVLLDIVFSNTPNANVIVAKPTTLQNAALGYSPYATNIPIYNTKLQALVNQRRALGQNLFLADMYSVVDYGTMFNSDHLHPNALGLKAIADEWATRIETITIRTDRFTSLFINGGATWKYSDTGQDPGTNWAQADFDDSGWSNGVARLGYGDPATISTVRFGPDPTNKFVTTWFRRSFVVPWNAAVTNLNFRLARADGAVVWLNGRELFRVNLPDGPIAYTNLALAPMTAYTANIFYPTNMAVSGLPTGTNVVAVEVHLSSVTNAMQGFDMELIGSGTLLPTPALSIGRAPDAVQLTWPATNGGFTLYATTNLADSGAWTTSTATMQTNGGQIVVTQSLDPGAIFFRLQRP